MKPTHDYATRTRGHDQTISYDSVDGYHYWSCRGHYDRWSFIEHDDHLRPGWPIPFRDLDSLTVLRPENKTVFR